MHPRSRSAAEEMHISAEEQAMAGAPQGPLFNAHISRTESIGALDKAQQDEEIARLKEAIEEGIEDTVWSEQFEWVATLRVLALCHSSVLMNEAKLLKACLPIVAKFENAARSVLSHLAIICFGDILRNCADFFKAKGNQDCMNEAIAMLLESTRRAKARVVKEEATKIMQQVGADLGLANLMLPAIINAGMHHKDTSVHDVAMGFVDHTIVASLEVNLPVNLLTAVVVKGLSLGIRSRNVNAKKAAKHCIASLVQTLGAEEFAEECQELRGAAGLGEGQITDLVNVTKEAKTGKKHQRSVISRVIGMGNPIRPAPNVENAAGEEAASAPPSAPKKPGSSTIRRLSATVGNILHAHHKEDHATAEDPVFIAAREAVRRKSAVQDFAQTVGEGPARVSEEAQEEQAHHDFALRFLAEAEAPAGQGGPRVPDPPSPSLPPAIAPAAAPQNTEAGVWASLGAVMKERKLTSVSVFKRLDKDGNGNVDREEFKQGMEKLGLQFSEEEYALAMSKVSKVGAGAKPSSVRGQGGDKSFNLASMNGTLKDARRQQSQQPGTKATPNLAQPSPQIPSTTTPGAGSGTGLVEGRPVPAIPATTLTRDISLERHLEQVSTGNPVCIVIDRTLHASLASALSQTLQAYCIRSTIVALDGPGVVSFAPDADPEIAGAGIVVVLHGAESKVFVGQPVEQLHGLQGATPLAASILHDLQDRSGVLVVSLGPQAAVMQDPSLPNLSVGWTPGSDVPPLLAATVVYHHVRTCNGQDLGSNHVPGVAGIPSSIVPPPPPSESMNLAATSSPQDESYLLELAQNFNLDPSASVESLDKFRQIIATKRMARKWAQNVRSRHNA